MPDMLVPLYKLPPAERLIDKLARDGIVIRRANPWELSETRAFIEKHFTRRWADEATVGFAGKPVSVFLATTKGRIVGFAAYECTRRDYFGPTGVAESMRGRGIGAALLLAALEGMKQMGYAYAIIGGAGPVKFYQDACGATEIAGSSPGIYVDLLKKPGAQRRK